MYVILLFSLLSLFLIMYVNPVENPTTYTVKLKDGINMDEDMGWEHTQRFIIKYKEVYPCSSISQSFWRDMVCKA